MPHSYKYHVLFQLSVFVLMVQITQAQEPQTIHTLQTNESGATKTYVARDKIVLKPGFTYSASGNNTFTAKIDAGLLFPPTENTYILPNGQITTDPEQGAVVGSIPGQFAVSPTGAATYTIPIECPPGINGMQPSIALVYNSQAGNGIAGWGWNLSGVSAITRTGKTLYHDNAIAAVQLTGDDNLMLDGQRLIRISGTNLSSNAEYRTELESFSKITCKTINGYLCFEVKTKEGLTMEYGSSADSHIEAQGSSVALTWLLRKVTDANGNYMIYNYGENNTKGEYWLNSIQYTGNASAGVSPVNIIEFVYQANRFDSQTSYIAGKKISQTKLLKTILVKTSTYIHKRYEISHVADSLYSKIDKISLFSGDNTKNNDTEILWGTPVTSYQNQYKTISNFNNSASHSFYYYDFNADGRMDFITLAPNATSVDIYFGNTSGGFTKHSTYTSYQNKQIKHVLTGDFNGDGYGDFAYYRVGLPPLQAGLYEYDIVTFDGAVFTHNCRLGAGGSEERAMVGDFNGDGKDELLLEYNSTVIGIDGFFATGGITWGTDLLNWFPNSKYQLDFNGDGKTDVFVMDAGGYRIYNLSGNAFTQIDSGPYPNNNTGVYFGDFNGDGKTDLLTQKVSYGSDYNETAVQYATGNGFEAVVIPWMQKHIAKLFIGDFNADGKSDFSCLVYPEASYNDTTFFVVALSQANSSVKLQFRTGFSDGNEFKVKIHNTTYNYYTLNYLNNIHNADFNGDGREDMLINYYINQGGTRMDLNLFDTGDESLLVKIITDGASLQNRIDYSNTSNAGVYTNTSSYTFPVSRLKGNLKIVNSYQQGNNSILFQTNQQYENARIHKQGKGFLGFEKVKTTDVVKGIVYENTMGYNSTYYNIYPVQQTVKTTTGSIISTTSFTNNVTSLGGKRIFPYVSSQTTTDHLTGLSETKTVSNFDNYGNARTIQTTKGGLHETQTIAYVQKGAWCLNKPDSIITTTTYAGQSDTIKIKYEYDNKGNLTKEIVNPNSTEYKVTTEYTNFNNFGQPQTIAVKAKDATGVERTRSSSMTYTPSGTSKGRFVTSKTNVMGETTTYDWDEMRGLLNSETIKGKTTYYTYDGFGRLKETKYPDGNRKTQVLQWAGGSGPTGAIYYSYTQVSGSAPIMTWFDALGREIRKDTYGLNNKKILTDTEYYTSGQNKGRVYRISEPYFEGDAKTWAATYNTYDAYGRATLVTTPMGRDTTVYEGLSTTIKTPEGRKTTTLNNSGFVESSTVNGKTVSYTYYPSGLTKTATPEGGQALLMEYNLQGKRTKLTDPDAGVIETTYNGFGELVEEKQKIYDASWVITTNDMESSTGRLNSINRDGEITRYGYDTQNRISSIEIVGQHKQTFSYDDFDRVTNIREEVGSKIFNKETEYDALGRVKKEIFPSGYYTVNHYDANGYLTKITDKQSRLVWEAIEENARGQLTQEKKGTKITTYEFDGRGLPSFSSALGVLNLMYGFNEEGNLIHRKDSIPSNLQTEHFTYDTQNRLVSWTINGFMKDSITYHSSTGNIQAKSDIGNYTMNYGEENGKPHALTSITGVPANFPTNELNVTYTDFKKIKTLTEGNKHYTLTYGIDDQRRMSIHKENNVSKETRYYLGDYEEKTDHTNGITEKIHYLSGAIYIERSNGTSSFYYAYTDYLGSLIALTNESGTVVERYAYDPWGKRRNPANWTQDDSRTTWIVNRGYTGHEHLDAFGIINMNGRVYDPLTAMFFSPDPFVQAPDNWLNYNRYAYAYGNPFKYTDPSGELILLYWLFFTNSGYEAQKIISPVAIKINWGIGSDVKHIGYEVSVGVPKILPLSYRYHYGQTYYTQYYDDSYKGVITMEGGEWSVNGYLFGIPGSVSFSGTTFDSGEVSQTTNKISVGNPLFNLQYENDYMFGIDLPGVPKGNGDRFRTAAVQINAGPFNLGLNMFTGAPDRYNPDGIKEIDGHNTYVETENSNPDKYRFSAFYIGLDHLRIGINSEKTRGFIQNDLIHKRTNDPYFRVLNRPTRFYWYVGTGLGSTLW